MLLNCWILSFSTIPRFYFLQCLPLCTLTPAIPHLNQHIPSTRWIPTEPFPPPPHTHTHSAYLNRIREWGAQVDGGLLVQVGGGGFGIWDSAWRGSQKARWGGFKCGSGGWAKRQTWGGLGFGIRHEGGPRRPGGVGSSVGVGGGQRGKHGNGDCKGGRMLGGRGRRQRNLFAIWV